MIMNMAIEIVSFPSRNDCFLQLWQFNRGYLLGKPEAVNGLIAMAMCNHISSLYLICVYICMYICILGFVQKMSMSENSYSKLSDKAIGSEHPMIQILDISIAFLYRIQSLSLSSGHQTSLQPTSPCCCFERARTLAPGALG